MQKIFNMKVGDNVFVSPDLTNQINWIKGQVIEIENNSFIGIVISVKTEAGDIFFGPKDLFKYEA